MAAIDLDAVDDLCRLSLVAGRLGCRVRLEGASSELCDLLELAGVEEILFSDNVRSSPDRTDLP